MHTVHVLGFGYLDGEGRGKFGSFGELMAEHLGKEDEFLNAAKRNDLDLEVVKKIFQILGELSKKASDIKPSLSHNDFNPKHIMVKDGQVVGIIDWGEAAGHSPINDFAKWAFWYDDIPLEWLKEGYDNQGLFGNDFESLFHWITLNNSLGAFWWYYENDYKHGMEDIVQKRVSASLKYFR